MSEKSANTLNYNINWREYHYQSSTDFQLETLEKKFPQFLTPHPLVQTSGRKLNEPLLGVVASWQGKPAGLVILEKTAEQQGLLVCWHVLETHRGFGLGQKLLAKIAQLAKSNGLNNLRLSFRGDSKFRQAIKHILQHQRWQTASKELMLYKFSPEQFMQMPWCQRLHLPKGFEVFSWDTLSAADKQHILNRQQQTDWFPQANSPLLENPDFEALNSVGLRFKGDVVGWMVTHRVHPNVIEYSSLFVSPEMQGLARGYHLIVEAVKRQKKHGVAHGIFQVQVENKAMTAFAERRMAETIVAQTGRWFSIKTI